MLTTSTLKHIGYDRTTKDYMASYDGNVIGFFSCYSTAEEALNDYVLGLCQDDLIDAPLAALADDPPPAPPVDDGPADNFGGWYAPGRCRNCGQPHATQRCPEILAALRTDPDDGPPPPWDAPDAGRAVGRQWLRDRARFLAVLAHLDRDAWTVLASAYCAWMNRGGCGLNPAHVVLIWTKALERDIALPPRAA